MDCCGLWQCFWSFCVLWWMSAEAELTTLITLEKHVSSSVKICYQWTGTNLHTQERNKRFSMPGVLTIAYRHLSATGFCQLLDGTISVIFRAGTCAHVDLFSHLLVRWALTPKMWFETHPTSSSKQPSHIMMNRCSFEGCEKRPTKNGNGRCCNHGGRTRCNHLGCDSIAQKGGVCGRHWPDKIYCSAIGCTNLPIRNGVCIIHGATQYCEIPWCTGR